jgi:hypothetical protein
MATPTKKVLKMETKYGAMNVCRDANEFAHVLNRMHKLTKPEYKAAMEIFNILKLSEATITTIDWH